jgi:hypothetical protein
MEYSKIYYISSNYRSTGNITDFKIQLQIDKTQEYTHCGVISATIPNTYYIVQNNYNTFQLIENNVIKTITVAAGNYNITQFINTVKQLLNANSSAIFSLTYSSQTNKIIYSFIGNISEGNARIKIIGSNLYRLMGFDKESDNMFVNNTITSTNVVNFVLNPTIYIHSDIVAAYDDNVLQEINSNNNNPMSNITFQNNNILEISKKISSSKNGIYDFYLQDNDDQIIDLNGNDFSFSLILFKKSDINEMLKEYIKIKLLEN